MKRKVNYLYRSNLGFLKTKTKSVGINGKVVSFFCKNLTTFRIILFCSIIISSLTLNVACKKKNSAQNPVNHPVPNVPVNINVYPNDPTNFKIQAIGGWVYYPGGINGIIIYRKSTQEFVAIERTSSYLPNNGAALAKVQSDNFTLKDTVSNSKWQIIDGTITNGPATWPLRLYGTSYDGNVLKIVN